MTGSPARDWPQVIPIPGDGCWFSTMGCDREPGERSRADTRSAPTGVGGCWLGLRVVQPQGTLVGLRIACSARPSDTPSGSTVVKSAVEVSNSRQNGENK